MQLYFGEKKNVDCGGKWNLFLEETSTLCQYTLLFDHNILKIFTGKHLGRSMVYFFLYEYTLVSRSYSNGPQNLGVKFFWDAKITIVIQFFFFC